MRNLKRRVFALTLALLLCLAAQFGAGASAPQALSVFGTPFIPQGELVPPAQPIKVLPSERVLHSEMAAAIRSSAVTNPDVKGWLVVPGTNMNFQVAHSPHSNDYYLYRDWRGVNYTDLTWQNWYSYPDSVTYLDFRHHQGDNWETTSRNVVLYGHNWTNLREGFAIGASELNNRAHRMFADRA